MTSIRSSRAGDTGVRRLQGLALLLPLLLVLGLSPSPASAASLVPVIDGAGGGGGRISASITSDTHAVTFGGVPHVFSYDATGGNLRHAYRPGTSWRHETLDGAGGPAGRVSANVGRTMSAVVNGTALEVFYVDVTNGNLRTAVYTASGGWRFQTLDGAGGTSGRVNASVGGGSSAVLVDGQVNVFYADGTRQDVRRATRGPQGWAFSVLDGAGGTGGRLTTQMGGYTRAAVVGGVLHVVYTSFDVYEEDVDFAWGFVRDATLTNGTWKIKNAGGYPWPFHADLTTQVVGTQLFVGLTWVGLHADSPSIWRLSGDTWLQVDEGPLCEMQGDVHCDLAGLASRNGRLAAVVTDWTLDMLGEGPPQLKYAELAGSTWTTPVVWDTAGGEALSSTVVNGVPEVFYVDGDLHGGRIPGSVS